MSKNQKKSQSESANNYEPFNWSYHDFLAQEQKKREQEQLQMLQQQQIEIQHRYMWERYNSLLANGLGLGAGIDAPPTPKDPRYKDKIKSLEIVEPRKVLQRMPDSITPIIGWRGWNIDSSMRLKAVGNDTIWEAKKQVEAICTKGQNHPVPSKECTCGVWAFKDRDRLIEALEPYTAVKAIGPVYLWGRVIETENGFRAQFAYPKELWLFDASLEDLGYIYNVQVRTA